MRNILSLVFTVKNFLAVQSGLVIVLLTACATPVGQDEVDWRHGARHGQVQTIYEKNDTPEIEFPEYRPCLQNDREIARRLVKIAYRHSRLTISTLAEVPENLQIKVLDKVEFWPEKCEEGRINRVTRVFPASPSAPTLPTSR